MNTPAGSMYTYRTVDQLPIVDAGSNMTLQGFSPNGNFGDSEILARRVLLAICCGVSMSEAMVTADLSNGNYASTRIGQYPALRHMERLQGEITDGAVRVIYEKWHRTEGMLGRLPRVRDDAQLDAAITPDKLPNFEAELVAGPASMLYQSGLADKKTCQEIARLDTKTIASREKIEEMHAAHANEQAEAALAGQEPQEAPGEEVPND
jgi:hypothetical protein